MVGHSLALVDGGDVETGPLAHGTRVVGGYHTEARPRLDRENFDLEPGAEARVVGEQRGDLGERVTGDHGRAWAPMSRR